MCLCLHSEACDMVFMSVKQLFNVSGINSMSATNLFHACQELISCLVRNLSPTLDSELEIKLDSGQRATSLHWYSISMVLQFNSFPAIHFLSHFTHFISYHISHISFPVTFHTFPVTFHCNSIPVTPAYPSETCPRQLCQFKQPVLNSSAQQRVSTHLR